MTDSEDEDDLYGGIERNITQADIDFYNKIVNECCIYSAIYNHTMISNRIQSNIKKLNSHDKFQYWSWFPNYD